MPIAWIYLLIAAAFEVGFAISSKYNLGWTNLPGSIATIITGTAGIYFLGMAAKGLPISTAYTVWIGIGAVGTVIAGIALFKEPIDVPKALCLVAIIAGVAGLKYLSGEGA